MKKFVFLKLCAALVVSIILMAPSLAMSAPTIYNLQNDWSTITNPNGVWAVLQGTNILPYQDGSAGDKPLGGTDYFAPGNQKGTSPGFLPCWWQGTDGIYTHSVDYYNGIPSNGESILKWTSPIKGTIDISGSIWFGQSGLDRNNNFYLYLNGTLLAQGNVSNNSHNGKANALSFFDALVSGQTLSGLSVNQNDVVWLVNAKGSTPGTVSGINLTITETANPVPVPPAVWLLGSGLLGMLGIRRKINK
jgi:hypothetical protein